MPGKDVAPTPELVAAPGSELAPAEPEGATAPGASGAGGGDPAAAPRIVAGRYVVGALIGAGGMGRVYRAHDRLLGRDVALKLLAYDGPDAAGRALREARAQARVDHPHVCQVYDAGAEGSTRYIAMQLIDGQTLSQAAPGLGVREVCRIAAAVAEGMHAAHRIGLVHRDLKPGNILVAPGKGGLHPYVTDFGLAADAGVPFASATGPIAGTPQFMSPEQARGQRVLDERSDVYSLGATLHATLAGKPPFEGPAAMVLHQILHRPPPPLRDQPREVRTILARCLEKDPARRYPSAGELADDLRRYLAGQPIRARPPSLAYRARKLLARNRPLAAVAAIAAATVVGLLGLVVATRLRAAERAELAQRLGQEVVRVEKVMRDGYTLPLHDVRREQQAVRARLAALRHEMARVGEVGRGPGEYALGRGALALHDHASARAHLEQAWRAGYRTSEVAYAAGQVLALLYQDGVEQAERIENPAARERRKRDLARELRDPALAYLRRADREGEDVPAAYVEGLIALMENHLEEARGLGDRAFGEAPGLYEAKRLVADARVAAARLAQRAGRYDEAARELEAAGAETTLALAIGRSDPSLHQAECARLVLLATVAEMKGEPPEDAGERARAACDRSLTADPRQARPHVTLAWMDLDVAYYEQRHGTDPRPRLAQAIAEAEHAEREAPADADPRVAHATALRVRASYLMSRHEDPTADLTSAIALANGALLLQPDLAQAHRQVGAAYRILSEHQTDRGLDPRPALDQATRSMERVTVAYPDWTPGLRDLASTFYRRAEYELFHDGDWQLWLDRAVTRQKQAADSEPGTWHLWYNLGVFYKTKLEFSDDPARALEAGRLAMAALERALALNPREPFVHDGLGTTLLRLAIGQAARGEGDPLPLFTRARAEIAAAAALNDKFEMAVFNEGLAASNLASYLVEHGGDPSEEAARARATQLRMIALDPTHRGARASLCEGDVARARFVLARGGDPEPPLADCQRFLREALTADPPGGDVLLAESLVHRWRAEWLQRRGLPAAAELGAGFAAVRAVRQPETSYASPAVVLAELYLLQLREPAGAAARAQVAREAIPALEAALARWPAAGATLSPGLDDARRLAAAPR